MAMNTPNTCPTCGGTGVVDGAVCGTCYGERTLPVENFPAMVFKDTVEKINNIKNKLDALDTKMDTLDTHLDVIEAKIDAL